MTTATTPLNPVDWTASADNPYPLYKVLRDEAPVFFDERLDTYILTRYDDVYRVLGDPETFSSVPLRVLEGELAPTSNIRQEDRPRHTLMRRTILPMFTPGEMRRLEPNLHDVVRGLIDAVDGQDVVNVTEAFAIPLPGRVTLDIIGLPQDVHARFKELTDERLRIIMNRTSSSELPGTRSRLEDLRAQLWEIVAPLAAARRKEPQHDVITLVVQAQEQHGREELPDEVVLNLLLEVLTAGFETTQHLIELLFDHLADDPALWARLRDDRSMIAPAMEEMLRFKSPTQALGRRPVQDVEFHGVTIPKDSWITTVYASANRDERQFPDPDRYDPDRNLKRHLASTTARARR